MTDTELLELAATHGTPLYIFDERAIQERVDLLTEALPRDVDLCFAIKANPFVVPALARALPRLEVCSPGELSICSTAGVDPASIVVSGVNKDPAVMAELVQAPALPHRFTIESISQLDMLNRLGLEHQRTLPALIRLSSGNQFGIDGTALADVIAHRAHWGRIDICGIQFFSGTQKSSPKKLARELDRIDGLLGRLERDHGWRAAELEYGPGLPVAYFDGDAFDEPALLGALADALTVLRFGGHVTLEIGRSLVASCGTYLTRVVDMKVTRSEPFAIVDGGIHHVTYFGQSMAMREPPCRMLQDPAARAHSGISADEWTLCGSLCTVNDILAKKLALHGLALGSVIAFEQVGAYSMTEGISLFLSRDLPAVITIDASGEPHLERAAVPTHPFNAPRR